MRLMWGIRTRIALAITIILGGLIFQRDSTWAATITVQSLNNASSLCIGANCSLSTFGVFSPISTYKPSISDNTLMVVASDQNIQNIRVRNSLFSDSSAPGGHNGSRSKSKRKHTAKSGGKSHKSGKRSGHKSKTHSHPGSKKGRKSQCLVFRIRVSGTKVCVN